MNEGERNIVNLTWQGGIAVVALEDRAGRNFFSLAMARGLQDAFAAIDANPEARVVVVHGYDTYFSCGGTRDQLIAISEGRFKYTDFIFFDLLRRSELPTIAAMQGHAIGGGLAFGLHADLQVFGEECVYSANFMEFGFTPGMACTLTMPALFGEALGWEMLYTGAKYRGAELRQRGAQVVVRPRAGVISYAMAQAGILAQKPVQSLKELKRRRREISQANFDFAVRRELEMQEATFGLPVVQQRIRVLFSE